MCGFIGSIGQGWDVRRGLPWLRRRGPDGHHVWASKDTAVTLLHTRLAIVDTDPRADQPFGDASLGITIALNGEIYNYRQLRRELAEYPFQTESDTEVIVAAYAAHGVQGFNRLNGMFAFVVVDEPRRRVFLVRDAVGKKPLFIRQIGDRAVFSSSVLPLVACGIDPTINPDVVDFYWRRAYVSPETSVINGVRPILPGQVVELDWQGREIATSRCEPSPSLLYRNEGPQEVQRNIHDLLSKSVDRRLENNPDPVALLSGGIDSTIVTQFARDRVEKAGRSRPLKVLTLGALVPYTQDEFYARYAARRLGIQLHMISIGNRPLFNSISRALSVQDEPLGMPAYFLLYQMVEAAAQRGRVLLTGDGGDEVFLGYRPPADWRSHNLLSLEEPPFVKVGPGPADWMATWARDVTGSTLLGHMFAKADRASAEQGVEVRCPLLDWSLFCYVRSVPYSILAGNGGLKPLLKAQLSNWPRWFLDRPKLGFAFSLRWRWALSRFDGLREAVKDEVIETFGGFVPRELRGSSRCWSTKAIINHFGEAWRLLVWSAFLDRLSEAARGRETVVRAWPVRLAGR